MHFDQINVVLVSRRDPKHLNSSVGVQPSSFKSKFDMIGEYLYQQRATQEIRPLQPLPTGQWRPPRQCSSSVPVPSSVHSSGRWPAHDARSFPETEINVLCDSVLQKYCKRLVSLTSKYYNIAPTEWIMNSDGLIYP